MNHPYGCTVNTAGKKEIPTFKALALAVGLVLTFPGTAATLAPVVGLVLAFSGTAAWAGEPISGVPVGLEGDPGSFKASANTDENGAFQFTKLPAGNYKLTLPDGLPAKSISVGPDGKFGGKVMRGSDGTAKITINGSHVGVGRGMLVKPDDPAGKLPGLAVEGNPISGVGGSAPKGAQQPGISDQAASGSLSSYNTAPPLKDGAGKLPGLAVPNGPIPGVPIGLEHDPEGIKFSANTDDNGAFQFTKLPAGNYKLTLPDGLPAKSISVGPDGKFGGKVMRGSDGSMSIHVKAVQDEMPAGVEGRVGKNPNTDFGSGMGIFLDGGGLGAMLPGAGGPGGGAMRPGAGKP